MTQHPAPPAASRAAHDLRQEEPERARTAPDVQLTRSQQPGVRGEAARRDAQLPHERDQHPDSQAAPEAPNTAVGEQAFKDVSRGLVDTDESLRKSSVDRRDGQPPQSDGRVPPREAKRALPGGGRR